MRALLVVAAFAAGALAAAAVSFAILDRKLDDRDERIALLEERVDEQARELRALRSRERDERESDDGRSPIDELLAGEGGCVGALAGSLAGNRDLGDLLFGTGEDPTVADVARAVERLRELRFRRLPRPRYLTSEELGRRVAKLVDEEYPDAEASADSRGLVALGALPAGSDVKALIRRALETDVAGFYVPETKELVVESESGGELGGLERIILAHELEHALADQALGLPGEVDEGLPREGSEDATVAASAVVEGDATLTMALYAAENVSLLDLLGSIGPTLFSGEELAELPYYLEASLVFPYVQGLEFVCSLHDRGGWEGVDGAYRRPPATSAQILFPERYFAREGAVAPPDVGAPGRGWRRLDTQAFGAADLLFLFQAPGDDEDSALSDARERAAAWAGGTLTTWGKGRATTVVLSLVQRRGERSLCESMREWARAAFTTGERATVRCSGRNVRVTRLTSAS